MQGLLSENTFLELHFGVKHGLLGKVIRILQDIWWFSNSTSVQLYGGIIANREVYLATELSCTFIAKWLFFIEALHYATYTVCQGK